MNEVVADTQSIIWHLFDPARLSIAARVASESGIIFISAITIVELVYLE